MSHLQIVINRDTQSVFVDHHAVGHGYSLNYRALIRSAFHDGVFDFFTCGCGEAGCAGISEGVRVNSDAKKVYWHIVQPGPEQRFSFGIREYAESLHSCVIDAICRLEGMRSDRFLGGSQTTREQFLLYEKELVDFLLNGCVRSREG